MQLARRPRHWADMDIRVIVYDQINPIADDFFRDGFRILWKVALGDSSHFYLQTLIGGLQLGLLVTSPPENQCAGPADYEINIHT